MGLYGLIREREKEREERIYLEGSSLQTAVTPHGSHEKLWLGSLSQTSRRETHGVMAAGQQVAAAAQRVLRTRASRTSAQRAESRASPLVCCSVLPMSVFTLLCK